MKSLLVHDSGQRQDAEIHRRRRRRRQQQRQQQQQQQHRRRKATSISSPALSDRRDDDVDDDDVSKAAAAAAATLTTSTTAQNIELDAGKAGELRDDDERLPIEQRNAEMENEMRFRTPVCSLSASE